jgi:hypothetical protein
VTEHEACALLKQRFEAAGFRIAENVPFAENDVTFDIDGFDADRRVGYEYLTAEAGDSWDVDGAVIAAFDARRKVGELHVLVVDEADAPDAKTLGEAADTFLRDLREAGVGAKPAAKAAKAAKPKAAAAGAKPKKPAKKK